VLELTLGERQLLVPRESEPLRLWEGTEEPEVPVGMLVLLVALVESLLNLPPQLEVFELSHLPSSIKMSSMMSGS